MHEREVVVVLEDLEQRVEVVPPGRMHLRRGMQACQPGEANAQGETSRPRTGIEPGFSTTRVSPSFPDNRPSYRILIGPATTGGSWLGEERASCQLTGPRGRRASGEGTRTDAGRSR